MNRAKNYELIWQALQRVEYGTLTVKLPNGEEKKFGGKTALPQAEIEIKNNDLFDDVITGGDVALGESYMEGLWSSKDLPALMCFLTLNSHALEDFFHAKRLQAFLLFIRSLFTRNTKRGSKRNIKAHYDLGNDFYELWLDESMTYSSALFQDKNISLFEAQQQKYRNILSKLNSGSILEIGCGWGGFAEIAAKENHQLTCLTISQRQQQFALERMKNHQLQNAVEIKLQDYRQENGTYDNIVSIEMFEAVGQEFWKNYFETLRRCLKPSGKAVLQIITIDEGVFKDYLNRVDFIQKHIFPGGLLPAKSSIRNLSQQHGLKIKSELSFGQDYAKTLQIWLERFDEKYDAIKAMGFSDEFIFKWRFYLAYCIGGFSCNRTDVVQFELEKI